MCEFSPIFRQFTAIICCNLLIFSFGLNSGWTTINLPNLLENANSTILPIGELTTTEGSFVVSLLFFGGLVGNFIILPISNYVGIKRTVHLFGLPLLASSILILLAKNVYYLCVSRFLCGLISGGLVVGIPTFINAISHDNVRGSLNSLYDMFNNTGMIISFLLGNYLNVMDQAKMQLIVPIIFMILMFLLPESPELWIKQRKEKQAIKSCRFYKGNLCALENVQFISNSKCNDVEYEQMIQRNNKNSKLTFQEFLTPKAKRSIFIAFVSLVLSFLSCCAVMISYITNIFEQTGSTKLSSKSSSLIISIVQLFANVVFINIVERFNRTTLYIWSSILTAITFVVYGIYCWFWLNKPEYELVSLLCFACIIFISGMGLVPIPYILCVEIFPKKIRQICLTLAVSMMWIVLFALDSAFLTFLKNVPLHYCMFILAVMSLLNGIFGIMFIPETRGKSYEEIMQLLDN